MKIGELFVELGIKGSEKTVGAISSVKSGLGETASMSLEAKAGILAVVYGMQQLMSQSMQLGTGLANFNALTGVSVKELQQWKWATQQAGVAGDEMANSLKSSQSIMTKMLMGEGAPKGIARLSNVLGGITTQEIQAMAKNPIELMKKLQEYALKETNLNLGNEVLRSFGISDNVISAMRKNAYRPDVLAKAPVYGDKDVASLDKVNVAWSNLGTKMQMAVGSFTAKHGQQMVRDISLVADQVLRLANAFAKLSDKLKLFEWFGKIFEGWSMIFGELSDIIDDMSEKDESKLKSGFSSFMQNPFELFKMVGQDVKAENILARAGIREAPAQSKTVNNNVNQTLNFNHDGKDHKKNVESHKKAWQDAHRQLSAQAQGT